MAEQKREISDNLKKLRDKEEAEPIASFLKMRLLELSPGYARVAMKVRPEYQNFHGTTFGGIITAVADQAFAYACNSLVFPSVAAQFNIHFLASPEEGSELIAECRVVRSGRRVGVSEITVSNQEGKLIAKATATSIPVS